MNKDTQNENPEEHNKNLIKEIIQGIPNITPSELIKFNGTVKLIEESKILDRIKEFNIFIYKQGKKFITDHHKDKDWEELLDTPQNQALFCLQAFTALLAAEYRDMKKNISKEEQEDFIQLLEDGKQGLDLFFKKMLEESNGK